MNLWKFKNKPSFWKKAILFQNSFHLICKFNNQREIQLNPSIFFNGSKTWWNNYKSKRQNRRALRHFSRDSYCWSKHSLSPFISYRGLPQECWLPWQSGVFVVSYRLSVSELFILSQQCSTKKSNFWLTPQKEKLLFY